MNTFEKAMFINDVVNGVGRNDVIFIETVERICSTDLLDKYITSFMFNYVTKGLGAGLRVEYDFLQSRMCISYLGDFIVTEVTEDIDIIVCKVLETATKIKVAAEEEELKRLRDGLETPPSYVDRECELIAGEEGGVK